MAEKTLNQIPRALREQYEKGKTAFERKNFEYAIAIFGQVLEQEPAFYDAREHLRAAQVQKASSGGTTFFKKVFSGAGSSPLLGKGQVELMSNPVNALKTAESILKSDPNSMAAHKLLARAAIACEFPKTAILSLQIVTKNSPKDEEALKDLARAYADNGEGEKAERIFAELMRLHPGDLQLADELKDISARKTLNEGGYEALSSGTGSYRDVLKNKEQAVALEQESRQVKSEDVADRMIREYEAQIAKEPNNLKLLRSVAELYSQKKEYDRALETYNRIVMQEGQTDSSLQKAISETTIKKFDHALAQLDKTSADYGSQASAIETQRAEFLLSDTKGRADRYPNDLGIRFELGELYFKLGKYAEAGQEFQKAQGNPSKRLSAIMYLGLCFAHRNMNDLAIRRFQDALKEKVGFDDEKKEILYALGTIFEKMGKKEEAIEQFKQIYEVDMGYKDVSAKVDAYYSGGGT
jgi:tetratricopeptide (TPR) repeat protein